MRIFGIQYRRPVARLWGAVMVSVCLLVVSGGASSAVGAGETADESAVEKPLEIGDAAPAVEIAHWFGEAPAPRPRSLGFEPGRVYVIEFWATWCAPCLESMPHLAELQRRYGHERLSIVSVSDEREETVREFLARPIPKDADQRTFADLADIYYIATDPDSSVYRDYMEATGHAAIPMAFIVGPTGRLEWLGGPKQMEQPLAQVISGTWDRMRFARQLDLERRFMDVAEKARQLDREGDPASGVRLLGDFLSNTEDAVLAYRVAARIQSLSRRKLVDAAATDLAIGKMRAGLDEIPEEFQAHVHDMLARLLHLRGEIDEAIAMQRRAVERSTPVLRPRFDSFLQDLLAEQSRASAEANDSE